MLGLEVEKTYGEILGHNLVVEVRDLQPRLLAGSRRGSTRGSEARSRATLSGTTGRLVVQPAPRVVSLRFRVRTLRETR